MTNPNDQSPTITKIPACSSTDPANAKGRHRRRGCANNTPMLNSSPIVPHANANAITGMAVSPWTRPSRYGGAPKYSPRVT
ncbi:MAG: hypothetical protein L0H93_21410 [Nocardioides sp.]|nr:hypothetical protein [Nocardioides sp.]